MGGGPSSPSPLDRRSGLPPRVRGNPGRDGERDPAHGPTPARAGQPSSDSRLDRARRAYPRACGATPEELGQQEIDEAYPRACGATPRSRAPPGATGAYPRACGATGEGLVAEVLAGGLPPRVRGNPRRDRLHPDGHRPTPARAGQPRSCPAQRRRSRAYPRACGATSYGPSSTRLCSGLPPRVRGNRPSGARRRAGSGPTPARAGQPMSLTSTEECRGAYPRACGATREMSFVTIVVEGLPPRVRGNLGGREAEVALHRPTPARAGQPAAPRRSPSPSSAYPRACGATLTSLSQKSAS